MVVYRKICICVEKLAVRTTADHPLVKLVLSASFIDYSSLRDKETSTYFTLLVYFLHCTTVVSLGTYIVTCRYVSVTGSSNAFCHPIVKQKNCESYSKRQFVLHFLSVPLVPSA